jgi:alkanesulfonate monooxygenase SsuD/methylene tetrahydromethanopterin reductase-like flavin-dependent oxidoreductase (luciferase family)
MADESNIGLIVPRFQEFSDFYQAADRMGFHSLWATEMLFNRAWTGTRGLDPFSSMATVAAATSQIRLGTAVMWDVMRDPVALAAELARMDRLSGGRLVLGMSRGQWPGEFEYRYGLLTRRRGGRLEEALAVLKKLWSEAEVSFRGSHFKLDKASIPGRPAQLGGIPVLISGTLPNSLLLAATQAEGWVHPPEGTPREVEQHCEAIRAYASEAGRDSSSLELAKMIYIAVDDDRDRARANFSPYLPSHYGRYDVDRRYDLDRWCAFGPPGDCAAFIRSFLDIGIKTVLLCPTRPDVAELERLHREVVPLLR